jgi:hypothetical protein
MRRSPRVSPLLWPFDFVQQVGPAFAGKCRPFLPIIAYRNLGYLMDDSLIALRCGECRRFVEPPFTPLYDIFGARSRFVVCIDCHEMILNSQGPVEKQVIAPNLRQRHV